MCLTSCGNDSTEPSTLPRCMGDAMVDKGAEEQTPCLLPMERRTLTAAGGLLPVGTASTAMRTIFLRPLFFWSLSEETKKSTTRTTNQLAPLCRWRVIQTKSRQTRVLDPGGYTGHLRDGPFLGGWHALRIGWARLNAAMIAKARAV